ncbi:hypothetical protein ABGB13_08695 [Nonomuraea sp. B10E8]
MESSEFGADNINSWLAAWQHNLLYAQDPGQGEARRIWARVAFAAPGVRPQQEHPELRVEAPAVEVGFEEQAARLRGEPGLYVAPVVGGRQKSPVSCTSGTSSLFSGVNDQPWLAARSVMVFTRRPRTRGTMTEAMISKITPTTTTFITTCPWSSRPLDVRTHNSAP